MRESAESLSSPPVPFDMDLRPFALRAERGEWLSTLIQTARADLRPRDFAERHLVDEMAFNKWRLLRIYAMEKAVYEQPRATVALPSNAKAAGGPARLPDDVHCHEHIYQIAEAHASDRDAVILAALGRLESRFHRQFLAVLKMLIALRRFNPLTPTDTTEKEIAACSHSKSPSDPAMTESPNSSNPGSSHSEPSKSS